MQYQVYNDLNPPSTTVLESRKATTFLEPGFVFAPWAPLQVTPVIGNLVGRAIKLAGLKIVPRVRITPEGFRGIMSHYSDKSAGNEFYGTIEVKA